MQSNLCSFSGSHNHADVLKLRLLISLLPDNSLEPAFVPLNRLGLGDFVGGADLGLASSALGDTFTRAGPEIVSWLIRIGKFCPERKVEQRPTYMQQ
jgi:hypothetical protein